MSAFTESLKRTTKTEWIVVLGGIALFEFLYHFTSLPRYGVDPIFYGYASCFFLYSVFLKKEQGSIKNRLCNAMIGGAFIYLFIEAISKLFAKWAVWKFF